MLKIFAALISFILDPFLLTFITWLAAIISLEASLEVKFLWLILVSAVYCAPPVVVFLYERKTGHISNWFMTQRLERKDVEAAWFIGALVLSLIFLFIDAPRLLLALSAASLVTIFLVMIVNNIWKISVHMMGISFFVLVMLLVYSSSWLGLALLIPLVAWGRMYLHQHTLSQVSIGTLLTIAVTYTVFSLFGLATF